jgi:hypothetical protein
MAMSWQQVIIGRLCDSAHQGGGWGYQLPCAPSAEPTALTCLALSRRDLGREPAQKALDWLAARQQRDGGVAINENSNQPCWGTALSFLAWRTSQPIYGKKYSANQKAAVEWLLRNEGQPFKSNPALYGHDTRLKAWSWVAGTHSWIEPTAYAVLALRAAGLADHARVREAVSLLLDRALSHGGWNYGNSKMFGSDLRPFPAQTGMVLAALAGEPQHDCIVKAIDFLHHELPRVRTPFSLAWGIIGAAAWDAWPHSAESWLAECADRVVQNKPQPFFEALLLLADGQPSPFALMSEEPAIGR